MLLAFGTGLRAVNSSKRSSRPIGNLLVSFAGLITALTLCQYLFEVNLGIDQLFFHDTSTIGTSSPGRMSPPTAICFLFGTMAVLSLDWETKAGMRPAQWFALAMAFVPAHILMSYAYGNMNVLAFGSRKSYMAAPTAVALMLLALAVLLYAPDRGLVRTLTARTQASWVFRRLLIALLLVPPVLGWLVLKLFGGAEAPPEFGVSTTVMLCVAVLAALAWLNATRLNRAELNLQEAKQEAERANRAKDEFLAMLSHELRTPLTPVLMTISGHRNNPEVGDDLRRDLEMLQRNIELEALLIDDLLDLTRITQRKFDLHHEAVDIHTAIEHSLSISSGDLSTKSLSVTKQFDATERHCWADAARLQQVFWNLLKNAAKFTPAGGDVEISTRNPAPGRIEIVVADNGSGIEPELMSRIFEPFKQGHGATRLRSGGLGLGLTICKRVIDLHHGTIRAASEGPGRGATFTITLETMEPSLRESPADSSPDHKPAVSGAEILLVEDHEDTARVLHRMLEKSGYGVKTATSVAAARRLAQEAPFDLVVSDLGLPDGSGLDLMRHLSDRHRLRGIALSGFGTEEDIAASQQAGFAYHLTKPVDWERLKIAIERLANSTR
jgi:signal transduction histidine kinase